MPHRPGLKAVEALDRGISGPRSAADGKSFSFSLPTISRCIRRESRCRRRALENFMNPPMVVSSWSSGRRCTVVLSPVATQNRRKSTRWKANALRQITHQNDALLNELQIAQTEEVNFKSKDGTEVHGLLTYPVGYVKGTKVPLLLRIHGGPNRTGSTFFQR